MSRDGDLRRRGYEITGSRKRWRIGSFRAPSASDAAILGHSQV